MHTPAEVADLPTHPALEALQFELLVETYVELGLKRPQAAAAAQADYLASNLVAFRRRDQASGGWLLLGLREVAA